MASTEILTLFGWGWSFKGDLMLRRWKKSAIGDGRTAISIGALVICSLLARIGTFEFMKSRVGSAIMISVAVEVLLAVCSAQIAF